VLPQVLYPLFRRIDFRGKGRLRQRLAVPREGRPIVRFPGGVRLRLDLRESLQRDFYFGLYDQHELRLVARHLRGGGDFIDVGAHIGIYAVRAAVELRGRGRVLAFEPNPNARKQLVENLALNGCENAIVVPAAVAASTGRAYLHVPASDDPSFSSLEGGRFAEGAPLQVDTTTVDDAVAEHGLRPSAMKIDVEGMELEVLRGAERTLADARPLLIVEVSEQSAPEVERLLGGYRASRVGRWRLEPGLAGSGLFNAVFLPRDAA
jgi:FkbM family methyltransferase